MPDERLMVDAQLLVARFKWLDAIERAVRAALGRSDMKPAKVTTYRTDTYTFSGKIWSKISSFIQNTKLPGGWVERSQLCFRVECIHVFLIKFAHNAIEEMLSVRNEMLCDAAFSTNFAATHDPIAA